MHKIDNIGIIANFVFSYICSFLPFWDLIILVNVNFDTSRYMRITFQQCIAIPRNRSNILLRRCANPIFCNIVQISIKIKNNVVL